MVYDLVNILSVSVISHKMLALRERGRSKLDSLFYRFGYEYVFPSLLLFHVHDKQMKPWLTYVVTSLWIGVLVI